MTGDRYFLGLAGPEALVLQRKAMGPRELAAGFLGTVRSPVENRATLGERESSQFGLQVTILPNYLCYPITWWEPRLKRLCSALTVLGFLLS